MAPQASEAGHWYNKAGESCYTVPTADGKGVRNTTLRDARKLGLVPSVTTIMKELAAPGLERWKIKEAVLVAKHLRRVKGENDDAFASRAMRQAQEQVAAKAEHGSRIHEALERWMLDEWYDPEYDPYTDAVSEVLYGLDIGVDEWLPEKSFCYDGYGGKVDAHCPWMVLDFKTKDFGPDDKPPVTYENHWMQLGAYRMGLQIPKACGGILYVSRTHPGHVHYVPVTEEQLKKGEQMFLCLRDLWQIRKGYKP